MAKQFNQKLLFAMWTSHNKFYHMYQVWDPPLRKLFPNIITFDPQESLYHNGKKVMNQQFLSLIKKEQPDIIMLQLIYDEFYIDTLAKIKKICPKTKVINFCGDDDTIFYPYSIFMFPFIDHFFITQPQFLSEYKKYGKKASLVLGASADKFKPLNLNNKYDVTFIGTPKADRLEFVKHILKNKINIKVFGAGWEKHSELKDIYGGKLSSEDFLKVLNQSKINLIFSKNYEGTTHVLDRLPEINFSKAFSLVEHNDGYYEIFKEGKDIATFKNKEELVDKIKYYLKNDKKRKALAETAYKKSMKDLQMEDLLHKLFSKIISDKSQISDFPKHNKKVGYLSQGDLNLSLEKLKAKLKNVDYIGFKTKQSEFSKWNERFQVYSLEKTKKSISCSNAYFYHPLVGDYVSIFSGSIFKVYPMEDFYDLLNISQLMTKKDFFLKNLEEFRKISTGIKTNLISEKNTNFVFFPLVRVHRNYFGDHQDKIGTTILPLFENELRKVKNKGNIRDPYLFQLVTYSLLFNHDLLKYLKSKSEKLKENLKPLSI